MLKKIRTLIIIAAITGPTILAAHNLYKVHRLNKQNMQLINDAQRSALEASDWREASKLQGERLASLRESLEAARQAGTTNVVRVAGETREVIVEVPVEVGCDVVESVVRVPVGEAIPPAVEVPEPSTTPLSPSSIAVSNKLELALEYTLKKDLFYSGVIHTKLRGLNWETQTSLPIQEASAELGPHLQRALEAYERRASRMAIVPRGLRHWRTGWFFGLGMYYDPFQDVSYDASLYDEFQLPAPSLSNTGFGLMLGWGVQF